MSDSLNTLSLQSIQGEDAWVSVIQKMDEAYAELVQSQVEVEQKNVELEEAKSFSDSIQSAMNDVLIVCDNDGVIEGVNRALTELVGESQQALIGRSLLTFIEQDYREKFQSFRARLQAQPIRDFEIEIQGKDGKVPLSVNCTARLNHRGKIVGMVLVGRALGELQRAYKELNTAHAELQIAQQRLIQSEKMASLGRLVAGVAHELNNPISFVYGNMHVLRRYTDKLSAYFDAVAQGESRDNLRDMREQLRLDKAIKDLNSLVDGTMEGADRVKEIVNDLRQFSSTQVSEKVLFDLRHVVHTALHWIMKETKFTVDIQDALPDPLNAYGHAGQIHQVVVNLIENAIDAMADSRVRQLCLSADVSEEGVTLVVSDTGPGISDHDAAQIFEPFYTTKPVGMGTGLGLSISYGIVSQHDGELSVDNWPEGGAVARLYLPNQEPARA